MRASSGKIILVRAAGAGLALLALIIVQRNQDWHGAAAAARDVPAPIRAPRPTETRRESNADRAAADSSAPQALQPLTPVPADASAPVAATPPGLDARVGEGSAEADETGEKGAAAIGTLPDNGVRDAPQRYPDDPTPIEDLLGAPSIWCDFGIGNNMGIRREGQLGTASAAWVGDPLEFDLLDVDQGTVRLRGSLGATGSRKGEVKMRVIADGARIHFMGLLPTGTLVTITIHGDRHDAGRDAGRHVAVMSRHEPGAFLTYAVQYLGSCE